jgi:hypothetical protein
LPLSHTRLLTPCVSASGCLLNIVWEVQPDGSFVRLFDSGTGVPEASALFKSDGSTHLAAILYADESSRLVLSTWRIDGGWIAFIADSGDAMGEADLAQVVTAPTGHLVVVCRDGDSNLLLIPFEVADDGTSFDRRASPCRSWIRVPSSALKEAQNSRRCRLYGQRGNPHGKVEV